MRHQVLLMLMTMARIAAGGLSAVIHAKKATPFGTSSCSWQACWNQSSKRMEASACLELAHKRVETTLEHAEKAAASFRAEFHELRGQSQASAFLA